MPSYIPSESLQQIRHPTAFIKLNNIAGNFSGHPLHEGQHFLPPIGSYKGLYQASQKPLSYLFPILKRRDEIVEMGAPEWFEEVDAITLWGHEKVDGKVLWGVDPQNRGYYLHGDGDVIPIVEGLIRMNGSADLSGTEGWKRQFSPKLRTIYGMIRSG